ncbi:MAG: hypothetical protein IT447_06250, partial [Phycisphaerales bacterium]|nr:hypothetical protein [Phycisphaerales bacterium]
MIGQWSWGFFLLLVVGLLVEGVSAQQANLVRDGSFEAAKANQPPSSWTLSGSTRGIGIDNRDVVEGTISLKLQGVAGQGLRLSQEVEVEPGTELLFTASVKSPDRVVATVGNLTMSYHRQGEWQTLAGLIRTGENNKITISFDLAGLSNKPPTAKFDDITLRKLNRPANLQRKFDASQTHLVEEGKPAITIVYPSQVKSYKALAERLRAAIADKVGVQVPILSDVEATRVDAPVLKSNLQAQNLILIGRLGINRAMWPAYNRFLDATDGYYPGGDGYVVRTAADVYRNGKNHLILGGSSDAGAGRAVEKFIEILNQQPGQSGTLSVPWLLQTELGGECLSEMKAHDARWAANDPSLPPIEPGYGTVRRWYENAMGYYWTGWDSYKQRAVALLEPVLKDRAYMHHYVTEFMVRTYDMLDDSPLYTLEQRNELDSLILSNFCDFCTDAGDISWMTIFSPPYDNIQVVNRHQIAPWMSDLTLADFLHDYFKEMGDLGRIVEFRRSEKDAFMKYMAANRWDTSLPGGPDCEHEEELALTLLRYALERDDYALFESGHARHLPAIPKIDFNGQWVRPGGSFDNALMFSTLASYYKDGRYLTLLKHLPSAKPFMNRYIAGVRRYSPGPELAATGVDDLTGLNLPPTMPQRLNQLHGLSAGQFAAVTFSPNRLFDFASFRSGFERTDDYVAVNGMLEQGALPGTMLAFWSRGMKWLGSTGSPFPAVSDRYFDNNGVHVLRTDRFVTGEKPYAAASMLEWSADLHRGGGVAFTLDPFMGMRWQRAVVWVRPGLFLVRDKLTARDSGEFQMMVNWRPEGGPAWDGKTWTSTTNIAKLRITPLSDVFQVSQNVAEYLSGEEQVVHFRQSASASMKTGDSVAALAVLQGYLPDREPVIHAVLTGKDAVYLSADNSSDERTLVAWRPDNVRGINSDAHVVIIRPDAVQMMGGRHLEIGGKPVLISERPVSVRMEYADGRIWVDNPSASGRQVIQVLGGEGVMVKLEVEVGCKELEIPKAAGAMLLLESTLTPAQTAMVQQSESTSQPSRGVAIEDQTGQWKQVWKYDGLRQYMPTNPTAYPDNSVADLGRVVDLAEIQPMAITQGAWHPRVLPDEIWVSAGDANGNPPAPDSSDWKKVEEQPRWRAGVITGNYGQTDPVEKDVQILTLEGVKARYIRSKDVRKLVFFDRDKLGSHQPLRITLTGSENQRRLFIAPHIWPKFVGWLPYWQDKVAMLDPDGKEIFQYASPMKVMDAQLLSVDGGSTPSVVLATVDAQIDVLDEQGKVRRHDDLLTMHQVFNHTFGRPNTRHPAGGFAMPFAVGMWGHKGASGPGMVVARYHSYSFLDQSGRLEGLLSEGAYVQPAILRQGIDFDGDGNEEQVCIGRGVVMQIYGPKDQRVTEPNGFYFYPQVYHLKRLEEPAWEERIDGAEVLMFEPIETGRNAPRRPRHIAIARENYVGIYDGVENKWAFAWVPTAKVTAAAVIDQTPDRLRMLV